MHTSALERFLRYVQIDTRSDDQSPTSPSTPGQLVLLKLLVSELHAMGVSDVNIDEHGVVMATVPATQSRAGVPTIGFIAHVDTSPEMPGDNVTPIVHDAWDGRDIVLPDDPSAVLRAADLPDLAAQVGHDIVTASGTTLLGADDKAGVAAIVAAAEYLIAHPEIPHGPIRIGFTPDEEIGRGANRFDVGLFQFLQLRDGFLDFDARKYPDDFTDLLAGGELAPGEVRKAQVLNRTGVAQLRPNLRRGLR
jgi:tripeptide aminopeptidase